MYSLDKIDLLIGRVNVKIIPLIIHFPTAIHLFSSQNGLKLSIIPVSKFPYFVWFIHKNNVAFIACI